MLPSLSGPKRYKTGKPSAAQPTCNTSAGGVFNVEIPCSNSSTYSAEASCLRN